MGTFKVRRWLKKICFVLTITSLTYLVIIKIKGKSRDASPSSQQIKVDNEPDFIDTEDNDLQEVFHTNAKEVIHTKNNDHQEVLQTNAKEKEMLHKDAQVKLPMKKKDIVQSSGISKNRTTDTLHEKEKTNKLMEKMKQSMLREDVKELSKMVKPPIILKEAVGPVRYKEVSARSVQKQKIKLIVIAREKSGFPVLRQFFNEETNFFLHGESPSDLSRLPNLLNCILDPNTVNNFEREVAGKFGRTPYFQKHCLLDSGAVCSDPLSYEKVCSRFQHQIVKSGGMSLEFVEQLLEENTDIKVVFLVRDPRGVMGGKPVKQVKTFCQNLLNDLKQSSVLERKFPGEFVLARFEVLAREPLIETTNLLKTLKVPDNLINLQHRGQTDSSEGWSMDKNPMQRINSWKQKLNINQIKAIENQCLETLSRLEYPILAI